jgi:hypothetical protein
MCPEGGNVRCIIGLNETVGLHIEHSHSSTDYFLARALYTSITTDHLSAVADPRSWKCLRPIKRSVLSQVGIYFYQHIKGNSMHQ